MSHFYPKGNPGVDLQPMTRPVLSHSRSTSILTRTALDNDADSSPRLRKPPVSSAAGAIQYLVESKIKTAHQFFYFKKKEVKPAFVRCSIADNLRSLRVEKVANKENALKTFHISELAVFIDLSTDMRRILRDSGFAIQIYGFRLQIKRKILELGTETLEVRDGWTSGLKMLINAYADFSRSDGLWRYLQLQCIVNEYDSKASYRTSQVRRLKERVRTLERDLTVSNRDIVALVIDEMVTKLEIREESGKMQEFQSLFLNLDAQYQVAIHDHESSSHQSSVRERFFQVQKMQGNMKVWKAIVPFMSFFDMLYLQRVSKTLKRCCDNCIQNRNHWVEASACGLEPRAHSWYMFCKVFCKRARSERKQSIGYEVKLEIQKDIRRSKFPKAAQVEEILVQLCSMHEDVGYCQGMHLTTEFLLEVLRDEHRTLDVLTTLMTAPYYLAEVWKPGLPRLKLLAYQLEELLKLKIPGLAHHFESLELPLEVLVAPWILTLFTQLVACYLDENPV